MRATFLTIGLLSSSLAAAQSVGTLTYKPPADDDNERPLVRVASLRPQANDFALSLEFDKAPWGEACKKRCANATLLIDTDADAATGLQAGQGKPQTGADLAIVVQGLTDYGEESGGSYVKVKIRQLADDDATIDAGDMVAELDHRRDRERLDVEGKEIRILIDASSTTLPAAKSCRLLYLAPLAKPVVARCRGMGDSNGAGSKVDVIRGDARKRTKKAMDTDLRNRPRPRIEGG
jgi:hypothetical protein